MRKALSAGILAVVFVVACGPAPFPTSGGGGSKLKDGGLHISTISTPGGGGPPTVFAPDVVNVGKPFTVSFSTLMAGCDVPDVVTDVSDGRAVTLTPYNRNTSGPGIMCPAFIGWTTRTADVVFTAAGIDTLNVYAYLDVPGTGGGPAQLGTITKTIQVTP